MPIIITEPAIGYGAGAALLFFRESIGEAVTKAKESGRLTPPDIYGVALAATENGTKAAGAFAMVTFAEQLWRYRSRSCGAWARAKTSSARAGSTSTSTRASTRRDPSRCCRRAAAR